MGACRRRAVAGAHTAISEADRATIVHAFETWLDGSHPNRAISLIEAGETIRDRLATARPESRAANYRGRVTAVVPLDENTAAVTFEIVDGDRSVFSDRPGVAVRDDGT